MQYTIRIIGLEEQIFKNYTLIVLCLEKTKVFLIYNNQRSLSHTQNKLLLYLVYLTHYSMNFGRSINIIIHQYIQSKIPASFFHLDLNSTFNKQC
ncbi:hypothetical protein pb186bvf_020175 [Paramecium bursaria]